jgi:hypothetical protein
MGIYYIGYRETDIAANFMATETDKFFAGSITIHGRNQGTNHSFNLATGIQPDYEPDQTAFLKIWKPFVSLCCDSIVKDDPDAQFMPFNSFFASSVSEKHSGRVICMNDKDLLVFLNSKFKFKEFMKGKLPEAEFVVEKGSVILQKLANKIYPDEQEVVIQKEYSEGGFGTIICRKDTDITNDIKRIDPETAYVVSNFIENICSVALHLQIGEKDIIVYPANIQILKGPNYAGSDIFAFTQLDAKVKKQCYDMAYKFGKILQNLPQKPRGFFGIDAIVGKKKPHKVYIVETNPRFTGTASLLNILSHKAGIAGVFEYCYRAFKGERLNIDAIAEITPNGRKRYAVVKKDESGRVVSVESDKINRDGFDKAMIQQETFTYAHSVFEEIKNYNTFDQRIKDNEFISQFAKDKKTK